MRSKRALIIASLAVLLVGLIATAHSNPSADPVAETVPVPEYVDNATSFVAAVDFTSATSAAAASVAAVNVATPGTEHLKADVVVRSELEGQQLGSFTMPHPAMSFADGIGYFFQAGRYDLLAPFDARAETLRLTTPDGTQIASIDTAPAIRDYCKTHPNDPNCIEADLSVDSLQASGPLFAVLGKPFTIKASSAVSNQGPDGPVDGVVTRAAVPDAGLALSPNSPTTVVTSLGTASYEDTYTATCLTPGLHTIDLRASVTPKRARVIDPDPTDDAATRQITLDCAVPITINIQPGSRVNPVNLQGSTLPVAALTTGQGEYANPIAFNATAIDASTLRFGSESMLLAGRGTGEVHGRIHPEDSLELDEVTRDGDSDAVLHFRPRSDSLSVSDTEGCVFGRTSDGLSFFGCDKVIVKA